MARDEAPPFPRGETYYNGRTIDTADLGGGNLEGKEFVFEVNAPNAGTTVGLTGSGDPSGRRVRVKVVRNNSGVALLPSRVVKFQAASTGTYGPTPLEGQVDGYCTQVADRPAGIVDEFLPAAGVPANDLFYIVVGGPTVVTQGATTASSVGIGDRLVAAAYGATAGDNLGGRFAKQDLTGATSVLGNQIQNVFAIAASTNNTAGSTIPAVACLRP